MKMKKVLVSLLAATFVLGACGGGGGSSNSGGSASSGSGEGEKGSVDTYSYVFSTDIETLDYLFSQRNSNSQHYSNFVDGLMEWNPEGQLVPALAESYKVSDDGLTYTYKIREGVPWVDSEGNEYGADVTANDWVAGLKHAVEKKSETLYIVADSIKGLSDYIAGKTDDFSTVGVKAVDDHTLEYTLNKPESYWNSKLTYGILYPANEEFLKEKGDDFGKPTPDSILYNGPYILTENTSKSAIEYGPNESYWDQDNVHVKNVKFIYFDGSDPDWLFKQYDAGEFTSARVYPNSAGYKDVEAKYKDSINFSLPGSSTFNMTFNFNRQAYENTSKTTDKQKEDTKKAIMNLNFRKAFQFAFDKKAYRAQNVGDAGAEKALRNTLVPTDFVQIDGKPFGEVVQDKVRAADAEAFGEVNLAEGQDGTYKPDLAKKYMDLAKKELEAEGVEFPIHLDLPEQETAEVLVNADKSMKQSVEASLGKENVVIDIQLLNEDAYYAATYQATSSAATDYDISTASGWGPDYIDPSSYLNIYNSHSGDMLTTLGLDADATVQGEDPGKAAKEALKFEEYDQLLDKADAITDDVNKRYEAYAEAEAWLVENVIQIPIFASLATPSVSNIVPFTAPYAYAGLGDYRYKYMEIQDSAVTTDQWNKLHDEWAAKREEAATKEAK